MAFEKSASDFYGIDVQQHWADLTVNNLPRRLVSGVCVCVCMGAWGVNKVQASIYQVKWPPVFLMPTIEWTAETA